MVDDNLDSWLRTYVAGGHEEKVKGGGNEQARTEKTANDARGLFKGGGEQKAGGKSRKRGGRRNRRRGGRDSVHLPDKPSSGPTRGGRRGGRDGGRTRNRSRFHADGGPRGDTPPQVRSDGRQAPIHRDVLRIIPLGGLSEVGKNMMAFEYEDNILVVDVGLQFPEEDMFGVDYVIPDISYLKGKESRIKGIFITHAHLDHIGAIPYLLPQLNNAPIYSTKLTRGLIEKRLEEFNLLRSAKLITVNPDTDRFHVGKMEVMFFRVNHSIPDATGITISCPQGKIVHTGDFKFDATPADGIPADMDKIIGFGKEGISLLFSDSTNATKPGGTLSEKDIGESLDLIIKETVGRVIIASFSSLIGRMQQVFDSAKRHGRTVFVSGRSMVENIQMAKDLGYLKYAEKMVVPLKQNAEKAKSPTALVLTTGSQGEPMSSLTRIAMRDHPQIQVGKGDTVILSSKPIAGNERAIYTVINNLCRLGARVIDNQIMDVHTSGHGHQDDLEAMLQYVKPKFFIPIHGEYYMRQAHANLAARIGIPENHIFMPENGTIVQLKAGTVSLTGEQADSGYVLIDGSGIGDKGAQVLMERQEMANNGVLIIVFKTHKKSRKLIDKPSIYSRGFLYQCESEKVATEIQKAAEKHYQTIIKRDPKAKYTDVRNFIHSNIDRLAHKLLARRPLIIPIVLSE